MDSVQKRGGATGHGQPSSSAFAGSSPSSCHLSNNGQRNTVPRSLGMSRRGVRGNFIPPVRSNGGSAGYATTPRSSAGQENGLEESTRRW